MSKDSIAALFRFLSRGVYVIGVGHGEKRNAFTAASVQHVSYKPLLLALSVNPNSLSYELLSAGKTFTVNVLKPSQRDLARRFGTRSGRDMDKLQGIPWRLGRLGAPILNDALAFFECEVVSTIPAGDHMLALGHVVDGQVFDADATPMSYAETGDMDGSVGLFPQSF